MDDDLDQLRSQRELIRRHLDWLDQKISENEKTHSRSDSESLATVTEKPLSQEKIEARPAPSSANTEGLEIEDTTNLKAFTASSGSELERAKLGCFIVFGVTAAIFLFILFGLPYLLN